MEYWLLINLFNNIDLFSQNVLLTMDIESDMNDLDLISDITKNKLIHLYYYLVSSYDDNILVHTCII